MKYMPAPIDKDPRSERFEQPIFLCLSRAELDDLARYQLKRHRRKLKPIPEPLPPLETGEEVEKIMQGNQDVARDG